MEYKLTIDGMGCIHCVKSVTEGVEALGAVVNKCEIGSVEISFDGNVELIREAIMKRGFEVKEIRE